MKKIRSEKPEIFLGQIHKLAGPAAWPDIEQQRDRLKPFWAVSLGEPSLVPEKVKTLEQRFSLREIVIGAAMIAHEAQKVTVDLTTEGKPIAGEVNSTNTREAWDRITTAVAALPDEDDGRTNAARAALFLATVFSGFVYTEAGNGKGWEMFADAENKWNNE